MRFLLISDTHGKLDLIDALAAELRAEAVIHAGDFGFFDQSSAERLSDRELGLQVAHADLPQNEKDRILALSRNGLVEAVRQHRLLGDFQSLPENLHILDHRRGYRVGPAFVYGLGGNLLPGGAGQIWGTLSQYRELVELADRAAQSPGPRIFVSHVRACLGGSIGETGWKLQTCPG